MLNPRAEAEPCPRGSRSVPVFRNFRVRPSKGKGLLALLVYNPFLREPRPVPW